MLDAEEIGRIGEELLAGDTPEAVARRRRLTGQGLRFKLLEAGFRIRIRRELQPTAAAHPAAAPVAAHRRRATD